LPEGVGIGFSPEHFVPGYTAQRTLAFLPVFIARPSTKMPKPQPQVPLITAQMEPFV
jgi:hypothetical protein